MHNNTPAKLVIKDLKEAKKYLKRGDLDAIRRDTGFHRNLVSLVMSMKRRNAIIESAIIAKANSNYNNMKKIEEKYLQD